MVLCYNHVKWNLIIGYGELNYYKRKS